MVEVLMSTMKNDMSLLGKANISDCALIINQTNYDSDIYYINDNVRWINTNTRGLSKSRNIALKNMTGDVVVISDDDVIYNEKYCQIIEYYHNKYSQFDMIAFQVVGTDRKFKKYSNKMEKIGYLKSMRLASVELTIKSESIRKNNLTFDEDFGSGAKHSMGEDNIFLFDSLRKRMKILYIPLEIASVKVGDSTWFNGYSEKYFKDLGAVYARMSKFFSPFLIIQFVLRKRDLYKHEITFTSALSFAIEGRKKYIDAVKEKKKI